MQQTFTLVLPSTTSSIKNKQQAENLAEELNPSDHLINNILNYSRSLDVKRSKTVGFIETVSN